MGFDARPLLLFAVPVGVSAFFRVAGVHFGLVSSIIFFAGFAGGLMLWKRRELAALASGAPLPKWALFFLLAMALAVLEENVNCPQDGCALFPWTLAPFALLFALLFAVVKLAKITDWKAATALFGLMGVAVEFFAGAYSASLLALPPLGLALMVLFVFLTYSAIILLPAYAYLAGD
ncbi:MAG: hypothetical protein WC792_02535 [Candidatus Micrarchaeia archaeon]|jgi:hypothetical protein